MSRPIRVSNTPASRMVGSTYYVENLIEHGWDSFSPYEGRSCAPKAFIRQIVVCTVLAFFYPIDPDPDEAGRAYYLNPCPFLTPRHNPAFTKESIYIWSLFPRRSVIPSPSAEVLLLPLHPLFVASGGDGLQEWEAAQEKYEKRTRERGRC